MTSAPCDCCRGGSRPGAGTRAGDEISLYIDDLSDSSLSNGIVAGLRIHPDVMLALGLADEPAPPDPL